MKTIIDFFQNSRISWDESGEIPEGAAELFISDSGSKYYTINNKKETFIIRVSDHWGMVFDCYWLIAGETQKTGEQRIGCARLSDFEDKKPNSWSSLKELYELLPEESFEIVEVLTQLCLIVIDYSYYVHRSVDDYGRRNDKIGWTLRSISAPIHLPANILIEGEGRDNLTINGISVPSSCSRESIVFAVGMAKLSNHLQENMDNVYYSNDFPDLFKVSGIPFQQEGDDFIFKIKNETLRVTMEKACDSQAIFSSFVKEIKFS